MTRWRRLGRREPSPQQTNNIRLSAGARQDSTVLAGEFEIIAQGAADNHAAAERLQQELWAYYVERSAVAAPFREIAQREGLQRTSMRNLAEYLIRLWTVPRPKRKPTEQA